MSSCSCTVPVHGVAAVETQRARARGGRGRRWTPAASPKSQLGNRGKRTTLPAASRHRRLPGRAATRAPPPPLSLAGRPWTRSGSRANQYSSRQQAAAELTATRDRPRLPEHGRARPPRGAGSLVVGAAHAGAGALGVEPRVVAPAFRPQHHQQGQQLLLLLLLLIQVPVPLHRGLVHLALHHQHVVRRQEAADQGGRAGGG
jgi:hypothetical protein